jgi:hypothetical protein
MTHQIYSSAVFQLVSSCLISGGGLAMALLLAINEMHLPRPAGAVLISPWVYIN